MYTRTCVSSVVLTGQHSTNVYTLQHGGIAHCMGVIHFFEGRTGCMHDYRNGYL